MSMTREEAIINLQVLLTMADNGRWDTTDATEAVKVAISALRPVSREQLDVVINSLKLRLENNEENGVVSIPKFAVEQMIERLEVLRDD